MVDFVEDPFYTFHRPLHRMLTQSTCPRSNSFVTYDENSLKHSTKSTDNQCWDWLKFLKNQTKPNRNRDYFQNL